MKRIALISVMMMAMLTSIAKDIKTVIFTPVPQMHCENCENKIKGNLRFEKGIKNIETSVEKQQVIITFDADKTSVGKLQRAFEKIGYEAQEIKGKTKKDGACKKEKQEEPD